MLLKIMSPASVPPLNGGGRDVTATVPGSCGAMPMRMSPTLGSSCWLPVAPYGSPLSLTRARLMLAYDDQIAAAFSNAASQVAVGAILFKVANRLLDWPPMFVPSG